MLRQRTLTIADGFDVKIQDVKMQVVLVFWEKSEVKVMSMMMVVIMMN